MACPVIPETKVSHAFVISEKLLTYQYLILGDKGEHIPNLEGKLRDVTQTFESKIEAQNSEIKKLQETLAKQHELTSSLLLTMSLGINALEKKLQDLQGIQNEANSKLKLRKLY